MASRTTSSLYRSQRKLDALSEQAVQIYEQILFNDYEALGCSSIPIKIRYELAKDILAKTLGNDKYLEDALSKKKNKVKDKDVADGDTIDTNQAVFSIVAR